MNRSLLSSLCRRSTHFLGSAQRFSLSKGLQHRSYVKPSGYHHEKPKSHPLLTESTRGPSSSIPYAIPAAVLGVFGGFVFYLHYNDEKRAIPKGQGKLQEGVAPSGPSVGGPFTLINTEHQIVTEKDLRGKWVLLYFGYTSSPGTGPAELQKLANVTDILESKQNAKVLPVFVTLDPQRDSASHVKAYLGEFDSRIVGFTGPVAAIKQMAQEYRVFFRKVEEDGDDYLVESSHNMYLINPNMEIVRGFGLLSKEDEMIEDILKEVNKNSGKK
ncbi:hypothetical protein V2J09_017451 [Rumex salicifolius]